ETGAGAAGVSRRQPVFQPQVYRRHGGRASLRRLQHVGHGLESRWPGLSTTVHASQVSGGKNWRCRSASDEGKRGQRWRSLDLTSEYACRRIGQLTLIATALTQSVSQLVVCTQCSGNCYGQDSLR